MFIGIHRVALSEVDLEAKATAQCIYADASISGDLFEGHLLMLLCQLENFSWAESRDTSPIIHWFMRVISAFTPVQRRVMPPPPEGSLSDHIKVQNNSSLRSLKVSTHFVTPTNPLSVYIANGTYIAWPCSRLLFL